ncbi:dTDP-4-dehydrorhamnose reductase [Neisseria lisongii]|uniref:dTDP-4-dehydrorhamnose reductase n=1 Tax=Neisseria lisongii TaxID=2912188 RepID=A0AAW5AF95_9NEIS|nr:dTDP-4-dehydrorhamnose reductase [Neisseria lisongii]MCF7529994.1 dTDP-4-dehydrorhamnose reductase [Neisseria lisongii]
MRILLTGSKGQLARCFRDRLPEDWELIATDSASLDITDSKAVRQMVHSFQPDAIVNAAAFTAVDKAESEKESAFATNAAAVAHLAQAAREAQARFIHISTDYVFDGNGKSPYRESDPTNPENVYGKSKLAGELLALAAYADSLIIRTSWVFSEYGHNFVKTMLKLGGERESLSIVNDQIGNPTYAGDLADAIVRLLKETTPPRGIYHFCGNRPVSWYEFAQAVFQTASQLNGTPVPQLSAVSSEQYPTPAARPAYSVLDCHKIQNEFGIAPSDWQKALNDILRKA